MNNKFSLIVRQMSDFCGILIFVKGIFYEHLERY